jgi:serine protease Do
MVQKLGFIGLNIEPRILTLLPGLRKNSGVVVVVKMATASGGKNPLIAGDIIHALNGSPIDTIQSLNTALNHLKPGSYLVLQVERSSNLSYMTFPFE